MLPSWVSVAVLVLTAPFAVVAARETLAGRFRPNPLTWVVWAAAPLIAGTVAATSGAGLSAVSTLATGVGPALVVAAAILVRAQHPPWPLRRHDAACGVLSVAALVGWAVTGEGLVAVVLAVAADALAGVPTVHKAWAHPGTETPWAYAPGVVSGVTGLVTLDVWVPQNWLFPAYIVVFCTVVVALVATGTRRVPVPAT